MATLRRFPADGSSSWSDAYKAIISEAGLTVVGEHSDEGDNHYYDTFKH